MMALFRRALAILGRAFDDEHNNPREQDLDSRAGWPRPRLAPGTSRPHSAEGSTAIMNAKTKDLEPLIAEAIRADRSIDELKSTEPSERAPRDVIAHHGARADRLFEADRVARNELIAALEPLLRRHPGEGVIVVAGDGSAAALAIDSDGLVIVPADRVIRLDQLASAEARAMVGDLAEQLRVHPR